MPLGRKGIADGPHQQSAHSFTITKTDFELSGMHIHIHPLRVQREEKDDARVTPGDNRIGIGCAQRADQQAIPNRAAIDEDILSLRGRTMVSRQRDKAGNTDFIARRLELRRVLDELRADQRLDAAGKPCAIRRLRTKIEARNVVARERERDIRLGQGETAHHLAHGHRLGAIALQEFQARGRGMEEVFHLHARARRECCGPHRLDTSGIDADAVSRMGTRS